MIYQHPLAYLLGLEGVALLHAFAGDCERDFTQAGLAEIRALLDSADQLGSEAAVAQVKSGANHTGLPYALLDLTALCRQEAWEEPKDRAPVLR